MAVHSEDEYLSEELKKMTEFWFGGSQPEFVRSLLAMDELTREEKKKVREILKNI